MKRNFILFVSAIMMLGCNQPKGVGIRTENLDTTIVPQTDFYQYATGGWQQLNPLTDEYSRFGSFDKLGLENLEQVKQLVASIAQKESEYKRGSIEQKIATLYNQSMNTERRNNNQDICAFVNELNETVDAYRAVANNRTERSKMLGAAMEYGLWILYVEADPGNSSMNLMQEAQAGFNLGEKEYYLDIDEATTKIREAYRKHIANMFSVCGYLDGDRCADIVLRLETRLATAALNNVELRDPIANYNKMSLAQLQTLCPQVDWTAYFEAMGCMPDSISIGQVRHLQEACRMLEEESANDLGVLFSWQIIDGAASYLSDEFVNANFDFYGRVLSGKKEISPLWKRSVGTINSVLGEAVGQMYVKQYFPEANKQRMLALVKNLQAAFAERIQAQDWMSDETKALALEKLNAFTIKIGYPDTWRDYSKLDIDPALTFYQNLQRAAKFEQEYSLSYLGKPVDKAKWYMTPQTVNAYYNPTSNEICFPAAILQYPFFDMNADDAFNYGAIGVVIGHEMTHGFDDQGCQFDKVGNLHNWWTAEDRAAFEARTKVMEEWFNSIEVAPGVHANGAFTLGENIADHGGLEISFTALTNLIRDGKANLATDSEFTPEQRFFLSYANVWAGNIRDEEVLRRTKSDPHSLGRWRVNGALPQIGAWYKAWNVDENSPMFIAPEKRVQVW